MLILVSSIQLLFNAIAIVIESNLIEWIVVVQI